MYQAAGHRRRLNQTLGDVCREFDKGTIQLWQHNREVNDRRAQAIATHIAENGFDSGPLPLVLGELPDGNIFLIDGQHRLRAGHYLGEAAARVEIEVVIDKCADDAALRKLFRTINIGTPVPLRYYDEELGAFIAATAPLIKRRWAGAYSPSMATTRPRFTDTSLQHQLGVARCREAIIHGLMSPEKFVAELELLCHDVETDYRLNPEGAGRRYGTTTTPTVYPKAFERGFCAGVMHDWGDNVAYRILARAGA